MKKIYYVSFILIVFAFFAGCGGQGQPQIRTLPKIKSNKKIVKINFPKYDCVTGKKINFDLKKYNFSNKIVDLSNYYRVRERWGTADLYHVGGIEVSKHLNKYIIDYKYGTHFHGNNALYLTEVVFKLQYKVLNNNTLEFLYPISYTFIPGTDATGFSIDPLDKITNLEQDINRIFNKLDTIKIKIKRTYILKGEINAKYPSESIYANFKRILGTWNKGYYYTSSGKKVSSTDIKKENTFILPVGKKYYYPIEIKVYPYRNGSKVIYKSVIPYTIGSDNTCSLTKEDIEKAKKFILKIVNN